MTQSQDLSEPSRRAAHVFTLCTRVRASHHLHDIHTEFLFTKIEN